jgi:hypothetical protein
MGGKPPSDAACNPAEPAASALGRSDELSTDSVAMMAA